MRWPFATRRHAHEILQRLVALSLQMSALQQEIDKMAGELDELKANVEANGQVEASAVALLQGLKAQLDAAIANNDMGAVKTLADTLGTQTSDLAAAVTANTPSAPPSA